MPTTPTPGGPPASLEDLTQLLDRAAAARRAAAAAILAGRPVPPEVTAAIARLGADLRRCAGRDHVAALTHSEDTSLRLDLGLEIEQLENDALYLEDGREALRKRLGKRRPGLGDAVRRGLKALAGETFNTLICDADALFRPAGHRLATSFQPAWNAVAACRFAMARSRRPVLWSEAPLPSLLARSALPPQTFAYAGSLGRQWQTAGGDQGQAALSQEKTDLTQAMAERITSLMASSDRLPFLWIGSGLQLRQGEISIARQDAARSIDEDDSRNLLEHIHDAVDAVDPQRQHFRVDDDGYDVAITPTSANRDLWNDFSPAEGLRNIDQALGLDLAKGPHLVCAAGSSGVALLAALAARTPNLRAILVTDRDDLAARARELCPHVAIVRHPDTVASILSAGSP
jgi:hypothetical protein